MVEEQQKTSDQLAEGKDLLLQNEVEEQRQLGEDELIVTDERQGDLSFLYWEK